MKWSEWPVGSTHYIPLWERFEYEHPQLSYFGVEGWNPPSIEEETKYWDELAKLGDNIVF